METFFLAFAFLLMITLGMSVGVIFMNKRIKGSCGGLNAIGDGDECLVCHKEIDPDSPLRERLACPKARKMLERAGIDPDQASEDDLDKVSWSLRGKHVRFLLRRQQSGQRQRAGQSQRASTGTNPSTKSPAAAMTPNSQY